MTDMIDIAKASIRGHEGLRHFPYKCTADRTTIGYGRNLEDKGLSREECECLLDNDIGECIQDLSRNSYWNDLNDRRQAALIDLRYCLGPFGFRKFVKMQAALEARNFGEAAAQILDSKFARQTGRRATNLATMIAEG